MSKVVKELAKVLKNDTTKKLKPYDTSAEVIRIDGGTAWVHIPGGVDETPVQLTVNANVGDTVQLRVSGGSAWIVGNKTAPPTDDTKANAAQTTAAIAKAIADSAQADASRAADAADSAEASAISAQQSATAAQGQAVIATQAATEAQTQAKSATNSANNALTQLSTVESVIDVLTWIQDNSRFVRTTDATVQAGKTYYMPNNNTLHLNDQTRTINGVTFTVKDGVITATGTATADINWNLGIPIVTAGDTIYISGVDTGDASSFALKYNGNTIYDADVQYPEIETAVAGTYLTLWIASGRDTSNDVFEPRVATENNEYEYEIVELPYAPAARGYFELDTTDAVKTYVQTHLALTAQGLYVLSDANGWKVLITNSSIEIQDDNGATIAEYASDITIGDPEDGTNVYITPSAIQMRDGANAVTEITASMIRLGYKVNDEYRTEITSGGFDFMYRNSGTDNVMAHIGNNGSGQQYYTFGSRAGTIGNTSMVIGDGGIASAYLAYSEGESNTASGSASHAEGSGTTASGSQAHSEGNSTTASHDYTHSEGDHTTASGIAAHSEGAHTTGSGTDSHAEGNYATASGNFSHAQNEGTTAQGKSQTVIGRHNVAQGTPTSYSGTDYALIIGNGVNSSTPSNALTVNWNGDVVAAGTVKTSNHSSAIGTVKAAYASAKSVATGTNTNLTSISLEAGTWVVTGGVRFPNNATGYRRMNIATSSAASWADVQLPALSGASTQLAYTVVVNPTSTKTYYLNCYHNAGTPLNLVAGSASSENGINFLRAVRIA